MAGSKKNKEPVPLRDRCTYWLSILSSIVILIVIIPNIPWRVAVPDPNFSSRFNVERKFSLLSAGDNHGNLQPWSKWRRSICKASQQYAQPNAVSSVIGALAGGTASLTGVHVGGASAGCGAWPACKNHVSQRCQVYTQFAGTGIACTIIIVISALCGFILPCFMGMEVASKKQTQRKQAEEIQAAKFRTMLSAIVALFLGFLAVVLYSAVSSSGFASLQNTAYYPFPDAHAGFYIAWVGIFFQAITTGLAVARYLPESEDDKEEEAQDQATLQNRAFAPGAPLLMDPGMGGMGGMPPGGMGMPPGGLGMPPGGFGPPDSFGAGPGMGPGAAGGFSMPALPAEQQDSPFPPM